jgi:hypothetical protein
MAITDACSTGANKDVIKIFLLIIDLKLIINLLTFVLWEISILNYVSYS